MERLTIRDGNEIYVCCGKRIDITEKEIINMLAEKLATYEDAEEQGRLVVLPCKVGDTVWFVGEERIVGCYIDEACLDNVAYLVSFDCDHDSCISSADFGKTVFLNRKAAEATLKEAQL